MRINDRLSSVRISTLASVAVLASVCAAPVIAAAYEIKAPWRSDSLPWNTYMQTSGHGDDYDCGDNCGMDLSPVRFDAVTKKWTPYKTVPSASPPAHEDWIGFGMQLYAPADGEVIGCWWNMPEELPGGAEPAACANTPEKTCVKSGNHLFIRTTDGHVLYLAHLQRGSIPSSLCPIPGTPTTNMALTESNGKQCSIAGRGGLWNGSRPDLQPGFTAFPKVKKGDPIARIGSSGAADTPHLHMSMYSLVMDPNGNPCVDGEPYEWSESFAQQRVSNADADPQGWLPLAGEELTFDVDNITHLLWGDPLGPRVDRLGIEDGTRPALATTPAGGVLAYRNLAGKLETIGFNVDLGGMIDPGIGHENVAVQDLDVARINATEPHAVVAVIDAATRLSVIPYFVEGDADVIVGTKRTETSTGAQIVRATASPNNNGIVAAIKNSLNGVSVVNYETTRVGTNISVTRAGSDLSSPVVNDLDIATVVAGRSLGEDLNVSAFKGVVTAERRADDTLWLQSWKIDSTGSVVTAVDEAQALSGGAAFIVSDLDVTVTGSFGGRDIILLSSALKANSNLRVQSWTVSSTGQLARIEQYDGGGPVSQLSSSRSGVQDAVVGMRLGPSQHSLLSFHVTSTGVLRRVGTRDAESLSALAVAGRSDKDDVIALFPDNTGELQLVRYISNYFWTL